MRPTTTAALAAAGLVLATTAGLSRGAGEALAAGSSAAGSRGKLVLTREDGSTATIRASRLRIRCERLDTDEPVRGIVVRGPRSALDPKGEIVTAPFVEIQAVLADVRAGLHQAVPTPNAYEGKGVNVFLLDPETGTGPKHPNELQSDGEDSSGSIFARGRCGASPRLELRIDATIDSEFSDAPPIKVEGSIVVRG